MLKLAGIRQAVKSDWAELGELQARSYHDAYRGMLPIAFLERVTAESRQADCRERLQGDAEQTGMLLIDSKAVGYISLRFSPEAEGGEITALYLLREYWGRGLGKRLMAWGIDRFAERGFTRTALWVLEENTGARRFYERQGFQPDGTQRVITRGDAFVQLRYERMMVL